MAQVDIVSTKHVETNEKFLNRFFEQLYKNDRFLDEDEKIEALKEAILVARNFCYKDRAKNSCFVVPKKSVPRVTLSRQRAVDQHENSGILNNSSNLSNSRSRPQTSGYNSQSSSIANHGASKNHPSESQRCSPKSILGVSRLQAADGFTSTPNKLPTELEVPEISFQITIPGKSDQSSVRRIQCDHDLSIHDCEMIVEIAENAGVDLDNSVINVSKKRLTQIAPGKYELFRVKK